MSIATRAAAAWREHTAATEADAARRAGAEQRAAEDAAEAERQGMADTAGLRRDAADLFAAVFGEPTSPDQWRPTRPGVTSSVGLVHPEAPGLEFAVWRLLVGGVEQLQLGARVAGSDGAFVPVPDLASLGALIQQNNPEPAPAATAESERTPAS